VTAKRCKFGATRAASDVQLDLERALVAVAHIVRVALPHRS
jgi:hypothetical protein